MIHQKYMYVRRCANNIARDYQHQNIKMLFYIQATKIALLKMVSTKYGVSHEDMFEWDEEVVKKVTLNVKKLQVFSMPL